MRSSVAALSITAFALLAGACHTDSETGVQHMCKTDVSSITSPAPGVITLMGKFYADESVIVTAGGVQVGSGTPASDRTAFSFINVPSGSQTLEVIASCQGGQDHIASETVVVK